MLVFQAIAEFRNRRWKQSNLKYHKITVFMEIQPVFLNKGSLDCSEPSILRVLIKLILVSFVIGFVASWIRGFLKVLAPLFYLLVTVLLACYCRFSFYFVDFVNFSIRTLSKFDVITFPEKAEVNEYLHTSVQLTSQINCLKYISLLSMVCQSVVL